MEIGVDVVEVETSNTTLFTVMSGRSATIPPSLSRWEVDEEGDEQLWEATWLPKGLKTFYGSIVSDEIVVWFWKIKTVTESEWEAKGIERGG